jgi:hypothetical protein
MVALLTSWSLFSIAVVTTVLRTRRLARENPLAGFKRCLRNVCVYFGINLTCEEESDPSGLAHAIATSRIGCETDRGLVTRTQG